MKPTGSATLTVLSVSLSQAPRRVPDRGGPLCSRPRRSRGLCRTRGRKPLDGFRNQLRHGLLRLFGGSSFWSSLLGLARFFQQLDISHGSPRDERTSGVFFFGVFFFDGFYSD